MASPGVTIQDRKTGALPEEREAGWRLDAERQWVIEGPPSELADIERALPATCATRVGPVLLLRFGNAVGHFDVPSLGRLEVHSGKWTEADFDAMLEDVTRLAGSLPFSAGDAGGLPYDRTLTEREDVRYHAFVALRHALTARTPLAQPLLPALHAILADPHRRLEGKERRVPLALAGYVDPARALQAALGPLDPAPVGHMSPLATLLGDRLPRDVDELVTRPTFDVPENRFVKAFLDLAVGILEAVRRHPPPKGTPAFARRLSEQCDALERLLRPVLQHGLWNDVAPMRRFPAESTVLQRRHGYRVVLHHFLRLRMATRLPLTDRQLHELLEVKDIATLYESWCFLQVVEALSAVLGPPSLARVVSHTAWEAQVPWGSRVQWADGTEAFYNLSFSAAPAAGYRSYSLPMRPDVVLSIPKGPNAGLHVLDAKFRVQQSDAEERRFRITDLHKMHTYRDALAGVRTAWVLYPGSAFRFYEEERGRTKGPDGIRPGCIGVGIAPLQPGVGTSMLRGALSRIACS